MAVEKTGLEAVFETAEFQKGLQIFQDGLKQMNAALDKYTTSVNTAGLAASTAGGLFGTGLSGGMVAAVAAAVGFVAIARKVVSAIGDMIVGIKDTIKESVVLASRWQELSLVAQLMGQKAGYSSGQILDLNKRIQDAGIRADVANKSIAQLVRMEMDPTLALELGKVAQNLAVISQDGADSSETLDRLMLGIQRLSPIILRYAGANVDLEQSYKAFAKEAGIVGRELTQVEKQQAAYNAVLREGAKVTGIYELSMESAGKQMRTLTGREIPSMKAAFGAPFQGAFLNVAKALREVVSTITEAISEGGRLYPLMVKLGAIADIITNALGKLATNGINAVIDFLDSLSFTINDSVKDAFSWGFDLVLGFAEGIVDAAASVLVTAINFVGSILASWLAPGSPPKVAPDIIKWGIDTMTEYLKGFTQADFGILRDIQSPLKTALDLMVQAGKTTKKKAADIFIGISEEIAKALTGGVLSEGLLSKIIKEAGAFGKEIAALVKGEYELAKASDAVAEAQERINEAIKKQEKSEKAIRELTDEYNRLLRAGASDDVLKAQLDQINAAEEQAVLAREQRAIAEDDLEEKQDTLDVLQEQVKLQKALVDQLLQLARAAIIPSETAKAKTPGGVGGAPTAEDLGLPDLAALGEGFSLDKGSFIDTIKDAVSAAKDQLLASWGEAWENVKTLFKERFGEAIQSIIDAWNENLPVFKEALERLTEIWDGVLASMSTSLEEWGQYVQGWWVEHGKNVQTVFDWLKEGLRVGWESMLNVLSGLTEVFVWYSELLWGEHGENLKQLFSNITTNLGDIVRAGLEQVGDLFDAFAALIVGDWAGFWEEIKSVGRDTLAILQGIINIGMDTLKEIFRFHFGDIVNKIMEIDWWQAGADIVLGLIAGVGDNVVAFIDTLVQMAKDAIDAVKGVFDQHSESKVFAEIGMNVVKGFERGVVDQSAIASRTAAQSLIVPAANRTMNVNQTNNIQSPMDIAMFRAMFNQVIREQFSGA